MCIQSKDITDKWISDLDKVRTLLENASSLSKRYNVLKFEFLLLSAKRWQEIPAKKC